MSAFFLERLAVALSFGILLSSCCGANVRAGERRASSIRFATFNIEDVRREDLLDPIHPRVRRILDILRTLDADVILLNELANEAQTSGKGGNAQRFAELLGAYDGYAWPTNTGIPSGYDLDRDGSVMTEVPALPPPRLDGRPAEQTPDGRRYGNDAWGFGTFPGQYAMALLVRRTIAVRTAQVRTFRNLKWSSLPRALMPRVPGTNEPWYAPDVWAQIRLASKSIWDVPIDFGNGRVIHLLASHPTPAAFDGEEARNKKRNHDEIRFWSEYLSNAEWIVDDAGQRGGFDPRARFVLLGDLNADPDDGTSVGNPARDFILRHRRVNGETVPVSWQPLPNLRSTHTAFFGERADYVVADRDFDVAGTGMWRPNEQGVADFPSDHFPVWADIRLGGPF